MGQYGGGPKTGGLMAIYVDDTGTPATDPTAGSYALVAEVEDCSIDRSRATAELRRRGNRAAKGLPGTKNPTTAEFRMPFGLDETVYDLLRAAYEGEEVRWWRFLSGPDSVNGNEGIQAPMFITGAPWDQPLDDVSGYDFSLMIGYLENSGTEQDESWYTVSV
ncbi:MAG: hypothetical protein KDA71_23645 [Planctomycetales bacterium]|nr:hypothetical protein [Planctomycetales bacterium]